jgi:hypothetical protein
MGVILFGGAQYSLPEQANLTLIFFPKIVGGGGKVTKKFFPDKKNSRKFFYDIYKLFRNLYVLPEFRSDFCPTVKIWGGTWPPHAPPPTRLCQIGLLQEYKV